MSETQPTAEITGTMFLFERPELMSLENHGALGFKKAIRRYDFCSKVRALPVTVSEIPAAMKEYPIIFHSAEQPVPLAVVGLVDDINLFVGDDGEWEENRYVPGYIRRYPFGVASETGGDRFAIVIDRAFDGFEENGESPLFENGEPSEFTKEAINFCSAYEHERKITDEFAAKLKELNLVSGQAAQFTPKGAAEPQTFAEYFGIDEKRLKELSDEQLLELNKLGLLPVIYASVMSMGNWRMIMQRRAKRYGLSEQDVLKPVIN